MPIPHLTTLCYIEKDGKYLMMHRIRKKNDINHDKWVGIGGHFEEGESPEECLVREVYEETGLRLVSYRFRGIVTFVSEESSGTSGDGTDVGGMDTEYMFLYTADDFLGQIPQGDVCNEGHLEWIDKKKVCDLPIWEGDKVFFRLLDDGKSGFSLKLRYLDGQLVTVTLDGENVDFGKS